MSEPKPVWNVGKAPKLAMTEVDIAAANCLAGCIFQIGSYNKRFARDIVRIARSEQPELTEKQLANLWRLVWRYRRQISAPNVLAEAGRREDVRRGNEARQPTPDHIKHFWVARS